MNIAEMHVWFRQYAQQMGMQNVRAILPEQIDVLINTAISDIVNQLVRENVGLVNDRVITDNVKLNQVNVLRTLYKVAVIEMSPALAANRAFTFSAADRQTGKMTTTTNAKNIIPDYLYLVDFSLNYKQVSNNLGYVGSNSTVFSIKTANSAASGTNNFLFSNIPGDSKITLEVYNPALTTPGFEMVEFELSGGSLKSVEDNTDILYVVKEDGSENEVTPYFILLKASDSTFGTKVNPVTTTTTSYIQPSFDADALETNYFPVRIIQDAYLADTLNDFVLKNRLRTPIIVTYNNGVGVNFEKNFDIYIDKFNQISNGGNTRYVLPYGLIPYNLRMSYIAPPAQVKYVEDLTGSSGSNVDCDLPESIHIDILKHAVDLYNTSINGGLYSVQQNNQAQQREIARNEARPANEGYQN